MDWTSTFEVQRDGRCPMRRLSVASIPGTDIIPSERAELSAYSAAESLRVAAKRVAWQNSD